MASRKRIAKVADPVVAGCLDRIRRCEMTAVGVLADHMEERGLPYAKLVRRMWDRHQRILDAYAETDFTRRKRTRWEMTAISRRILRRKIATLFGRVWFRPPLESFR